MNVDDENILPSTNLSLALGYSNHWIQSILNSDRGAGSNAASRFLNQEPSLLYALEPLDMASGSKNTNKPVNEEMFMASLAACKLEPEVAAGDGNSSMFPSTNAGGTGPSDQVEETENKVDLNLLQEEDPENNQGEDEFKLDMAQKSPTSQEETIAGFENIKKGTHVLGTKTVKATEKHAIDECEANETEVEYAVSSGRRCEKGKMGTGNPRIIPLESTDENMLGENALCMVALKSADMFDSNTQQDDCVGNPDKTFEVVKQSSNSSKFETGHMNDRAVVLADGQEDHSGDTVESCNSTGQVSTGKRQWNFEQTLIVENKKFKRQIHESPGSSTRQDSSFMNWISNMTKGLSKLPEGQAPSHQEFVSCNENKRHVGFQSMFRSLYSQRRNGQEAETKVSEMYDMNATPIACRMASENLHSSSISGNAAVDSKNMTMDLALIKQSNTKSTENRNSSYLASNKEKDVISSNSSHEKCKTNCVEKIDSEMPYKGKTKTAHDSGIITDPFSSLWISRFTKKASGLKSKPQLLNLIGSSNENETDEVACVKNRDFAAEASSFGFDKIKGQDNATSSYKLNHVSDSSRYDIPEAMASIFARRLDALKHIGPSNVEPDKAEYAAATCFFCGIKGHHLQECPDITATDLEDLLRNFNSYDGAKEMSCVCIRCFQLNHWAVSCPIVCKRLRNEPESDTYVANQCGPSEIQLDARNEDDQKQEGTMEIKACNYNGSGLQKGFPLNWNSEVASTSQNMALEIVSSSGEKMLKENKTTQLSSLISRHISDGIFDAMRSLRLTRTDILKWINSGLPVSNLDGFFLRLRLGKWEEGLGGTGYHAAYITGSSGENSKGSIPVNVGGMKCLVKSQYVSNHDFLEDELRAWCSATLRAGHKIPSEEELQLKVQQKKRLGL